MAVTPGASNKKLHNPGNSVEAMQARIMMTQQMNPAQITAMNNQGVGSNNSTIIAANNRRAKSTIRGSSSNMQ